MEHITDTNGKKISVSYFGNLQNKIDTATGYIQMYNAMASEKNAPQIDLDRAVQKIKKQHDRFYGNESKYDGKGNLKEAKQ